MKLLARLYWAYRYHRGLRYPWALAWLRAGIRVHLEDHSCF